MSSWTPSRPVSVRRATRRVRASSQSRSTVSSTASVTPPSHRCTGSGPRCAPFLISDGSSRRVTRRLRQALIHRLMAGGTTSEVDRLNSASSSRSPGTSPCRASCVRAGWCGIGTVEHHALGCRAPPGDAVRAEHRECPPAVLHLVGKHHTMLIPVRSAGLYLRAGRQERSTRRAHDGVVVSAGRAAMLRCTSALCSISTPRCAAGRCASPGAGRFEYCIECKQLHDRVIAQVRAVRPG